MKKLTLVLSALAATAPLATAFPPAPHHEVYGTVRDAKGNPLSGSATVSLRGPGGEVLRAPVDPSVGPGVNYTLKVPMDAGTLAQLYRPGAMLPSTPFTVTVTVGQTSYVPIEVVGRAPAVGDPSGRTRLDLTLGVDSDGDGLPDAWERDLIDSDGADGLAGLEDVRPGDDVDGDGLSNYAEYIAGTYAFEGEDAFKLEVLEAAGGVARSRFLAVNGRTYRLESASDARGYAEAPFALERGGSARSGPALRASETRYQDIFVAVGENRHLTFRMRVE